MYEHKEEPLLPSEQFKSRLFRHITIACGSLLLALLIGMLGYHHLGPMDWIDAFLNASMILSGMGPVADLQTDSGKIFSGLYAIFSGIFFLALFGVVAAPLIHRALHKFHVDIE